MTLTKQERSTLLSGCRELLGRDPDLDLHSNETLSRMTSGARHLPARLVEELALFRWTGGEHGALLVRDLPLDPVLPDTPTSGQLSQCAEVPICTTVQLLVLGVLGDLISYAGEKGGALVQDVVPLPDMETRQENSGSSLLELHTENGFHPIKPDFVTLLCIRPDHDDKARTVVAGMHNALPLLSRGSIEQLRRPSFRIAYSSSFTGPDERKYSEPCTAIEESTGAATLVADLHAMEGTTASARAALAELFDALRRVAVDVRLRAGDLLAIDNRSAVHGRTGFVPRFDGQDRWLRRAFAIRDILRSEAGRPPYSRIVHP